MKNIKHGAFFWGMCGIALVFGLSAASCKSSPKKRSLKVLTPHDIEDVIGGKEQLKLCQFFISKDVVLRYVTGSRDVNISEGTARIDRRIERRTIDIFSSTEGVLQIKNDAGKTLDGYIEGRNDDNEEVIVLNIAFDPDTWDNVITFHALYNKDDDRFELIRPLVLFDG